MRFDANFYGSRAFWKRCIAVGVEIGSYDDFLAKCYLLAELDE